MDTRKVAERADRRVLALTRVTLLVLLLVAVGVEYCVATYVPGVMQALGDLPRPVFIVVVTIPGVVIACGTIPVHRWLRRRADRLVEAAGSPAAAWAAAQGWNYRHRDEDLDDDVWQAAFGGETYLESAVDVVSGRWGDHSAWASFFTVGRVSMGKSAAKPW